MKKSRRSPDSRGAGPPGIDDGEVSGSLDRMKDEAEQTEWAIPIQERHLAKVREGSLTLAAQEDPS